MGKASLKKLRVVDVAQWPWVSSPARPERKSTGLVYGARAAVLNLWVKAPLGVA